MVVERIGGVRSHAAKASLTLGASQTAVSTVQNVTTETAAPRATRL